MEKLLDILVEIVWKRLLLPIYKKLDRADLVFLLIVALAAFVGWQWREFYNFDEKWLGVSALGFIVIIWFVGRRVPTKGSFGLAGTRLRGWPVKIFVPLMLVAGWSYGAFKTYRIPAFPPGVMGIFIARFDNDPGDYYQARLVQAFKDQIGYGLVQKQVAVNYLPRRIGENDTKRALQLGQEGNAAMVLWGTVERPNSVRSHLAMVKHEGMYTTEGPLGGGIQIQSEPAHVSDLPSDLQALETIVPVFLTGYEYYELGNFDTAIKYFQAAEHELVTQKQVGITPEKALLASAYLYIGHAFYNQNKFPEANDYYEKARAITARPVDQFDQYVNALNSLGELNLRTGKITEARDVLEKAQELCRDPSSDVFACIAASYNLGMVRLEVQERDYDKGIEMFNRAAELIGKASTQSAPNLYANVLAIVYEEIAYSYVRKTDASSSETSEQLCNQAEIELGKAEDAIKGATTEQIAQVQELTNLTRARMLIIKGQQENALELLGKASANVPESPEFFLLLAIACDCADKCNKSGQQSLEYLNKSRNLLRQNQLTWRLDDSADYFGKMTAKCRGKR